MRVLVTYDVSDDRRRDVLSRLLLDYGERIQESVFWVDADEELIGRMRVRIRATVSAGEDSVWIVPLCEACARRVEAIGVTRVPEIPDYYIV